MNEFKSVALKETKYRKSTSLLNRKKEIQTEKINSVVFHSFIIDAREVDSADMIIPVKEWK